MKTILGHRGIIRSKENTKESIIKLLEYNNQINGYKIGIEFDIQMYKNDIICYHDDTKNNEIENVLYFSEIVDCLSLSENNYILDIELKYYENCSISDYCNLVIDYVKRIKKHKIILTSFSIDVVKYILTNYNFDVGIIVDDTINCNQLNIYDELITMNMKYIIVNKNIINYFIKLSDIINLKIYTVFSIEEDNEIHIADELLIKEYPNIGLITDDIDRLINIIK